MASLCSTSGTATDGRGVACKSFRTPNRYTPLPCRVCVVPEENREVVLAMSGLETVLEAMVLFTWNESVQSKACWVLSTFASQHGS